MNAQITAYSLLALFSMGCENGAKKENKEHFPQIVQILKKIENPESKVNTQTRMQFIDLMRENVNQEESDTTKIKELKDLMNSAKTDGTKKHIYEIYFPSLDEIAEKIINKGQCSEEDEGNLSQIALLTKDLANCYGATNHATPKERNEGVVIAQKSIRYFEWLMKNNVDKDEQNEIASNVGKAYNIAGNKEIDYTKALYFFAESLRFKRQFYEYIKTKKETTRENEIEAMLSILKTLINIHYRHLLELQMKISQKQNIDEILEKFMYSYGEARDYIKEIKDKMNRIENDSTYKNIQSKVCNLGSLLWINTQEGFKIVEEQENEDFPGVKKEDLEYFGIETNIETLIEQARWIMQFAEEQEQKDASLQNFAAEMLVYFKNKKNKNNKNSDQESVDMGYIQKLIDRMNKSDKVVQGEISHEISMMHAKDKHQEQLDIEKERQQSKNIIIGLMLLLLSGGSFSYWRSLKQNKVIQEQYKELAEKNKLIEKEKKIIEEQREEIRTQNEELKKQNNKLERTVEFAKLFVEQLQKQKEELKKTHEDLQNSHEELATANEELKSNAEVLEMMINTLEKTIKEKDTATLKLEKLNTRLREIIGNNKKAASAAAQIQNDFILTSFETINNMFGGILNTEFFFSPKDIVSGDFYWAEIIGENRRILGIGDCVGHGVEGCLRTIIMKNAIVEALQSPAFQREKNGKTPLKSLLIHMNEDLNITRMGLSEDQKMNGKNSGMDLSWVLIDSEEKKLHFLNAGKQFLHILYSDNTLEKRPTKEMKINKNSISSDTDKFDSNAFEEIVFDLNDERYHDAQFFMFSDGIPDQFGGPEDKKFAVGFGIERLLKRLGSVSFSFKKENILNGIMQLRRERKMNPEEIESLSDSFLEEVKPINLKPQTDDITFLAFNLAEQKMSPQENPSNRNGEMQRKGFPSPAPIEIISQNGQH